MITRAQKIRLGIFVFVGAASFIALIMFFTTEKLLQSQDTYYIAYNNVSVSGLEVGSPVMYLGLKVGTVEKMTIDRNDVSRIIVKIKVRKDTPIKQDAHADIVALGITGLRMIEIRGASRKAELLPPNNFIEPGSNLDITNRINDIAMKADRVFGNLDTLTKPENLERILEMIDNASALFAETDAFLEENRSGLRQAISSTRGIMAQLDSTSMLIHDSAEKIRNFIYSDTLAQTLANTRDITEKLRKADLGKLITDLGDLVEKTNQILMRVNQDIDQGSSDFSVSMRELRTTLEQLQQASDLVQENPSVLLRGVDYSNAPDKHLKD